MTRPALPAALVLLTVWGAPAFGAADTKRLDPEPGEFSWSHLNPPELQYGCVGSLDEKEEGLAKVLEKGDADEQLAAARALWKGRSRRHAAAVLKYLAGPPPGGAAFRAFRGAVEDALQPAAILRELQKGDYLWGTWLAFLRPHKDLVPVLLQGLKAHPDERAETMLALGSSGDPRALAPLLELLAGKDYRAAGEAARALGYLGLDAAEPKLIEALAGGNPWRQVNASNALATLGSRKALPALKKLAESDDDTGALNVRGCAARAVKRIERRTRP
ncbi:hypothetical protein GobsT_19050 [Gemmata obscuriglobus]|uniref:HEAT repeat domain-containing protein n=1 Tax=Gemmata obscuriglobus TaxID=114 RepID=A0A2Z3HDH5_9BACT|nr:HEAT repeat domain-containing protein [Gemmata obscuriglobus]AWM39734.1 HEAT repeat domain-containing protein [Gemmata obscuriglobus]QEG27151.1 hypothetical protein GobsT_19050 [Gemmata obscuriglobus]VTS03751.1 hypothetical protein : Predicted signal transduction protein containing Nacht domain OS=Anabaena variabilis (strain ATCC 29413 / PCC 7937) GN=Ava_3508 PE=4 SV=1: HEAT_2 [Gemmata obscuriglobus UQM 2246]